MKKLLLIGISLCTINVNVWALEARLVPNPIMQGESTELIISSDKPFSSPENLKELTQNFMLAGQQQRQSSQFINGIGSTTYELAFVLFPLRQGELAIPALKVGSEQTKELILKVLDKKQVGEKNSNSPVLELTAEVSNSTPYIGQTVFYTLTLTDDQGILNGEIIPTKVDGIKFSQVGQDEVNSVLKKGKRVNEIKRTYALVADQVGKIELPPALFNGQIRYQAPRPSNQHRFFGLADAEMLLGNFFDSTRPVSFTSNPISIEVQPKPTDTKGWWLPSPKVELSADYQISEITQVGDTISGKLILTAQDVNATDMPVPALTESADFRLYPQPEERSTIVQEGKLLGRVIAPFMLVPLKSGKVEIPPVSVSWFNTKTKKSEMATVPARPLNVEQGEIAPALNSTNQEIQVPPSSPSEETMVKTEKTVGWLWVIISLFSGVIIGGLVVFVLYFKKSLFKKKKEKPLPDFYPFK